MSIKEADAALAGPLGEALGFKRTRVVLPWTTTGSSIRNPPDTDATVEVFVEAKKNVRELWEEAVKTFGAQGREYYVYHDVAGKEEVRVTYQQAGRTVEQLSWALQRLGVKKGDRVGIAMRNFPEYLPAWWAAICVGAISVPLNSWLVKDELDWCISNAGCKVVFIDQERLERLGGNGGLGLKDTAAPKGPVQHFIAVRCKLPEQLKSSGVSAIPYPTLLDPNAPNRLPDVDISGYDSCQIMFSSGTTGRPKGVTYHHLSMTQQAVASRYAFARNALRTGMDVPETLPQTIWILPVPLFHLT